ncbi:MAG: amylo-alpha-1,6-glucosidase [Syntrophales bacterium]|jgi:predicted glycogen debranching enzyme|nr:amylo-alpha-1,6-glucosidase [Syntrophales bacterium]
MSTITINTPDCIRSRKALTYEWLETNGLGGYASSSILLCHTRKYHGLLVANLANPSGRYVLISKVEDSLVRRGEEFSLVSHQYPDFFFSGGQSYLEQVDIGVCPKFVFRIAGRTLEREIMMIQGTNSVILKYRLPDMDEPCMLSIKPFLAYRSIHSLSKENTYFRGEISEIPEGCRMAPYEGMPAMYIQVSGDFGCPMFGDWYKNFEYEEDRIRGYNWREDLYCPGTITIPMDEKRKEIYLCFTTDPFPEPLQKVWNGEWERRDFLEKHRGFFVQSFKKDRENIESLFRAADQLLIRTPHGRHAILAGYHWFYEWGRDSLISLPGLTFCRGLMHEGQEILKTFGDFEQQGLFPNFFTEDEKENAYNTVDASLWYFWAVQQYLKYGGDENWVHQHIWPVMKRILKQFLAGTIYDIYVDERGLLHAGSEGIRLTWMDAAVNGLPVTPRWGYMVEINALWFNAVCFSHELSTRYGDQEFALQELIPLARRSFRETFWVGRGAYLGDVSRQGILDEAVRPNQIFAVSLPYSPLDSVDWNGVVKRVQSDLLTPCGLRTLDPAHPDYRGNYNGVMIQRDRAYHQGTVWPWLWGHFGEAYLRVNRNSRKAKNILYKQIINFLKNHLGEAGLGCVSEVFDGNPPHRPNGCISQAWSIAELIRLLTLLDDIR